MKKIIFTLIFLLVPIFSYAHGNTEAEVARGGKLWRDLQTKEVSCVNLADEDFDALGEYFMGQMIGDAHEAMNNMMETMMGEEGERGMHVVMGKRLSGCDTKAALPAQGLSFMPMMQMMIGYGANAKGFESFIQLNFLTYLLIWIVLILVIAALVKWLFKKK